MPMVRFIKKVVQVPDTWEAWAMRVLTIGIVIVLMGSVALVSQVSALREQVANGRNERNAYQIEQTERVCTMLRSIERDPKVIEEARC